MTAAPFLERIFVYPIKSLDRAEVRTATISPGGALMYDRRFAIFDEQGVYVNAKRTALVHRVRVRYEAQHLLHASFTFPEDNDTYAFDLGSEADRRRAGLRLGEYFGFGVELRSDEHVGFPDDRQRTGPTVIASATYAKIAEELNTRAPKYGGGGPMLGAEDLSLRMRANLEIGGVPPFWEDRLSYGAGVNFQVGDITVTGLHPCARCVVPSRHPENGAIYPGFAKMLTDLRRESLPPWADRGKFDHYFRLAVNTRIQETESNKSMSAGDEVQVVTQSSP